MAVIVNGDGILTGISSLATALTDITSGRGTITGVTTVGTLQLGAGISISSPRTQNAAIFTNNTEFLTVDDAGRVGVGTITPNSDAHPENEKKINVGFITAKSIAGDIDARNVVVAGVSTFVGAGIFSDDTTFITANGNIVGDNSTDISGINDATLSTLIISDTITHTGDTDTKIRFPAADTITAETGGSERLRIDSSGRLLIGSTAKAGDSALQVYTSDQLHPAIRTHSPNANGYTMFGDAYKSDESNINFGISYSSASLVISQGCKVNTSSDNAYVSSQDTYSTKPNAIRLSTDGSFSFHNTNTSATTTTDSAVSLTERMRITSDGKFGLGTNSPSQKLHLSAASGDVYNRIDTNVNGGLLIYVQGNQRSVFANDSAFSGTQSDTGIGAKGNLIFRTRTSSYDERVRIQSDGDVGIGTIDNSNNERLRIQDDASTSTTCQVSIISGNAERAILNFGDAEDPNIGRVSYHNNTNTLSFFTDNSERLSIDSTGAIVKQLFTATNTYAANDTTQCGYQSQNLSDTTNTYSALRLTAGNSSPATAQLSSIRNR